MSKREPNLTDRTLNVLEELEVIGSLDGGCSHCPSCYALPDDDRHIEHTGDCRLAQVLREWSLGSFGRGQYVIKED